MTQGSLLDWVPPPELMVEPPAQCPLPKPRNPYLVVHLQKRLRFYQRLRSRLIQHSGKQDSLARYRAAEIPRLEQIINDCKHQIKGLFA